MIAAAHRRGHATAARRGFLAIALFIQFSGL